jgi:predicted nuclease of restriction endonuclease-like (RecB) superfamily
VAPYTLIPWGHNILVFTKSKSLEEAMFYIQKVLENGWSRLELTKFIKEDLYGKSGVAPNNFATTLTDTQSLLAKEITKDPYTFDFIASSLRNKYLETELEDALTKNITEFLLELGQGFAYMGRQVKLKVGRKTYKLDLLFYHVKLRCYIAIDLKLANLTQKTLVSWGYMFLP